MCNSGSTLNRDQWRQGGDCRLCRRQPYCKKVCKAHKQRTDAYMGTIIARALTQSLMKKSEKKEGENNDSV